jgi:hypothetical protein
LALREDAGGVCDRGVHDSRLMTELMEYAAAGLRLLLFWFFGVAEPQVVSAASSTTRGSIWARC